jgi:hypothetical protein
MGGFLADHEESPVEGLIVQALGSRHKDLLHHWLGGQGCGADIRVVDRDLDANPAGFDRIPGPTSAIFVLTELPLLCHPGAGKLYPRRSFPRAGRVMPASALGYLLEEFIGESCEDSRSVPCIHLSPNSSTVFHLAEDGLGVPR